MFMDELERIDRCMNSAAILNAPACARTTSFAISRNPMERVAHSGPPAGAAQPAMARQEGGLLDLRRGLFEWMQYSHSLQASTEGTRRSRRSWRSPRARVGAAPCSESPRYRKRVRPRSPILVAGCTVAQVLEAMARVGKRAGLECMSYGCSLRWRRSCQFPSLACSWRRAAGYVTA